MMKYIKLLNSLYPAGSKKGAWPNEDMDFSNVFGQNIMTYHQLWFIREYGLEATGSFKDETKCIIYDTYENKEKIKDKTLNYKLFLRIALYQCYKDDGLICSPLSEGRYIKTNELMKLNSVYFCLSEDEKFSVLKRIENVKPFNKDSRFFINLCNKVRNKILVSMISMSPGDDYYKPGLNKKETKDLLKLISNDLIETNYALRCLLVSFITGEISDQDLANIVSEYEIEI